MTRDEAFDKLVNASEVWTQAQQVILNQIYDDFSVDMANKEVDLIMLYENKLEVLQKMYDQLDFDYTQLKDDNANS